VIHLIYIPGLGDDYDGVRRFVLKFWQQRDVRVTYVPMSWSVTSDDLGAKFERIIRAIDSLPVDRVVLIGESAGAAMALVAAKQFEDQVDHVVTICGKHRNGHNVKPGVYRRNPAFYDVMQRAEAIVETLDEPHKKKISMIYSSRDSLIPNIDTLISGVEAVDIAIPGHKRSILYVLFFRRKLVTWLASLRD